MIKQIRPRICGTITPRFYQNLLHSRRNRRQQPAPTFHSFRQLPPTRIRHRPYTVRHFSVPSDPPTTVNESFDKYPAFEDLPQLCSGTKRALQRAGLIRLTEVQAKTMDPILDGKDVIARARTGTGKGRKLWRRTMAYLIPAIERILKQKQDFDLRESRIDLLIISPTRELAEQIYREACLVTQQHASISCQVMYGGVPKRHDLKRLQAKTPSILIATPGRLLDHLESTILQDDTPFADHVAATSTLILDEVDRLLEMGFSKDIMEIISYLPAAGNNRQTLLFSATMPLSVKEMVQACVRSGDNNDTNEPLVVAVDCIQDSDPATHTSNTIEQTYVLLPPDRLVSGIVELIVQLRRQPSSKIVVFFPTTAQVEYFYHLLASLGHRVFQIHSKLSQPMRIAASDQFRFATTGSSVVPQLVPGRGGVRNGAVLLTTDLSARGVDYPDVTHVIQVGATNSRENYLHRLGRTGRAGKTGQGVLVIVDLELEFLQQDLAGLNVQPNHRLQGMLDGAVPNRLQDDLLRIQYEMRSGQADNLSESAVAVYKSILGYYSTRLRSLGIRSSEPLVELVNAFASQAGLVELPIVPDKLARQSGLLGNTRIRVDSRWIPGNTFQVGGQFCKPRRR